VFEYVCYGNAVHSRCGEPVVLLVKLVSSSLCPGGRALLVS
jgi:hypothetical protein